MQIKKMLASALTAGMMLTFIPATSMADSTGWKGNYDDGWRYYTSGTEYVKNDWKKIDGEWYYFSTYSYYMYSNGRYYIDREYYRFNKKSK